ncbi:hypothetical protein OG762_36490 [Streptomyces sp. NBC_01136]|uniref:hypothetical protein n=1 Tax=Streptomyces sp. NBC_01136 TaxID=2903754 RepID=UPI0038650A5E|nr:hypothetical protein OG762_36490 [Streptomyces sp. NBC_01136]
MNAEQFNAAHPVGTPVVAYPGTRDDEGLIVKTRTPAWELGHGAPVVSVDDYAGGICLTHVDVLTEAEWEQARAERDANIVARRAVLLAAIQARPSGEWTAERAGMALRRAGFQSWNSRTATGDLQALAADGHLVAHTEIVIRGYGVADAPVGIVDPFLAARIAERGVPLSADYAPQPAHRWQQLRTDLIHAFSPYMPSAAVTETTDKLDGLIRELGAPGLTPRDGAEAGR